jgi:hypothetical protein
MQLKTKFAALIGGFLFLANAVSAQTEYSSFTLTGMGVATPFARDYQALGINPANLDLPPQKEGHKFAMGYGEIGMSFYSEALTKSEVRSNLFNQKLGALSYEDQKFYATEFANAKNSADLAVLAVGFSAQTKKLGTFSFSVQDKANLYYQLGPQASQLMWLGRSAHYFTNLILTNGDTIANYQNISPDTLAMIAQGYTALANAKSVNELLAGTHVKMSWVRQFNFGYGKRVLSTDNFELYAGVGFKYLLGQGMMSIDAESGQATAFAALSPLFKVDYSKFGTSNPSALSPSAGNFTPVGNGFGIDLGATFVFKKKLTIAASVTDIGKMTWDGNVYELKNITLTNFTTSGFENIDIVNQIQNLNGADGLLDWKGSQKIVTKLPSTMRAGAAFKLNDHLRFGVDVISPLNNDISSMQKGVVALGGEYSPVKWLRLSAGYVNGGNYGNKVPVGINFVAREGGYEIGFASRDAVTFFRNNSPTISMCMGFMRFHF